MTFAELIAAERERIAQGRQHAADDDRYAARDYADDYRTRTELEDRLSALRARERFLDDLEAAHRAELAAEANAAEGEGYHDGYEAALRRFCSSDDE